MYTNFIKYQSLFSNNHLGISTRIKYDWKAIIFFLRVTFSKIITWVNKNPYLRKWINRIVTKKLLWHNKYYFKFSRINQLIVKEEIVNNIKMVRFYVIDTGSGIN